MMPTPATANTTHRAVTLLLSPVAGVSGVVGFSGRVDWEGSPRLARLLIPQQGDVRPQADGLAGEVGGIAVHQLCHTRQLPGGGDGELGIRPVIPREIHCPVPAGGGEVFHHDLLFRYALRQGIGVAGSRLGKGDGLLIAFAVRIVDGGNVIAFPPLCLRLPVQSRGRHHQLSTMHKASSSADTRFLCCFLCRSLPL